MIKHLEQIYLYQKKIFEMPRNNQKVVVKITKYPQRGKNAEGEIIEVLGSINEAGVDMLSLNKRI